MCFWFSCLHLSFLGRFSPVPWKHTGHCPPAPSSITQTSSSAGAQGASLPALPAPVGWGPCWGIRNKLLGVHWGLFDNLSAGGGQGCPAWLATKMCWESACCCSGSVLWSMNAQLQPGLFFFLLLPLLRRKTTSSILQCRYFIDSGASAGNSQRLCVYIIHLGVFPHEIPTGGILWCRKMEYKIDRELSRA